MNTVALVKLLKIKNLTENVSEFRIGRAWTLGFQLPQELWEGSIMCIHHKILEAGFVHILVRQKRTLFYKNKFIRTAKRKLAKIL